MFCFALADRLHKTLSEITAMPTSELAGWSAYLSIIKEEQS